MQAAVDRFGRIDVLVNNAGNFYAGFFEEISPEDFRAQIETTLFGPINVTRAVLPVMRAQRSGLVVDDLLDRRARRREFLTAYAASKFGVEGWMESLAPEVAPFGIRTMLVEPGFFRTELLDAGVDEYAESSIEDYAERTAQTVAAWKSMNGQQGGDPAKLADALVQLAAPDEPPLRFAAGADAVEQLRAEGQGPARPGRRPPRTVLAASPTTTLIDSKVGALNWREFTVEVGSGHPCHHHDADTDRTGGYGAIPANRLTRVVCSQCRG